MAQRLPPYPPDVPHFVRHGTRHFGDRPLIRLGERCIRYAEADAQSARWARGLVACGIAKGTRVGVLLPNGPDWVVAWLAIARIGGVCVPLNTFYQARELGWALRHADVDTLLCAGRFLNHDYLERIESQAPGLAAQAAADGPLRAPELPFLRRVFVLGEGGRAWTRPVAALDAAAETVDPRLLAALEDEVCPADPMLILYSSGSTADPKGAVHTHGSLLRHAFNLNAFRDLTPEDRIYTPMPFFWVGGFTFVLVSAMHAGAALLCEESFEPGRTLAYLERERATIVAGWPHYAKAMVEHPSFRERDLSSVRSGNLYAVLPEALRPRDPELRSNSLGMTETGGPHSIDRMDVDLPETLRGSFGRTVPGLEHRIVDPQSGAPLLAGEVGEIQVRGYSLMQSIYKREREEVFDADGFYPTGDLGHFDAQGHLYFHARLGDMIKTGANVAPREVEVVLESLPGVKSAYVVGLPDPDRGQVVAAAVVPEGGGAIDAEALRVLLKAELAAYKVPRHFFGYAAAELPFTDSGKIDKRALAELLAARI